MLENLSPALRSLQVSEDNLQEAEMLMKREICMFAGVDDLCDITEAQVEEIRKFVRAVIVEKLTAADLLPEERAR